MDKVVKRRFSFLRQSSLAPDEGKRLGLSERESEKLLTAELLDATLQLLFHASKGNVDGVVKMLDKGTSVDAADLDKRTALHVASCEGKIEVVKLLLQRRAFVNSEDRWGSTPLADAQHYGNIEVCNLLESHGGKLGKSDSLRRASSGMPEYEIDPGTLSFNIEQPDRKGDLYRVAIWQGTKVWVKLLPGVNIASNDQLVPKFKEELALLLKLRHPNVVQLLGAVTQTKPMMIVTEFLTGGNLKSYMEEKNQSIEPAKALSFALNIAKGMNYLHVHKPECIMHGDLKPSNLLLGESSGHIKVANFGLSQSIRGEKPVEDHTSLMHRGSFCRYMAPEIFSNRWYDRSVDTFAFGLILQEMLEGRRPFAEMKEDYDVAQAYYEDKRPPFRHSRRYPLSVKELIEQCWDKEPSKRPLFSHIIQELESVQGYNTWKSKLKSMFTWLK